MNPELEKRIAAVAADCESGASELLEAAMAILRDAAGQDAELLEVSSALRTAQPTMAPIWNATAAALRGDLSRFAQRVGRAPDAIARFASELLETGAPRTAPVQIVTFSYSATVFHAIHTLARRRPVHVACSEGRPALEGRRLASRLAAAGIPVTYYVDGALGHALESGAAALVGADAVGAEWFLNKSGTRLLAACAAQRGVPVYVLAGREKFASSALATALAIRSGPPSEVWADSPPGVAVENPYFERIPLDLTSAIVSDVGVLSSSDAAEVCRSMV